MPEFDTTDISQEETTKAEVASELEEARKFAKSLSVEDVKSGQWFVTLLLKMVQAYDRNARAQYFQQKYPGLHPDEIADVMISVAIRYATITGAIAGAATTAGMITTLSSAGMTTALLVGTIGAEMLCLARIQMRLVLDLSVIYDLQLDTEDPEDMLMVFGYALGVAPTEMLGKGLQVAAGEGAKYTIRTYINKGTLKVIQDFGSKIGVKILQRTIIKYAMPVASAVVGSSYNYITTKSVGRIAKSHLKNRGQVTDELRLLVSRQNTYSIAFPAAIMYMAQVDGEFSPKEKEFYRALLSRMSFEEHTQAEFQKLIADDGNILEAIAKIEDNEVKSSLVEVMVLMAIYDGELVAEERGFLIKTATYLNVPLNIDEVERRVTDYRITVEKGILEKATGAAKDITTKASDLAGQAAGSVKDAATATGNKITSTFGRIFQHRKDEIEKVETSNLSMICANCGNETPVAYKFCPHCGQSF